MVIFCFDWSGTSVRHFFVCDPVVRPPHPPPNPPGPDFSKITTIHGDPNLIELESERISKLIRGPFYRSLTLKGMRSPGAPA